MKQQFSDILIKLGPSLQFIKRYLTFGVAVLFLMVYAFLVFRINALSNREPLDSDITSAVNAIPKPHVDQKTVDKIQQLQDQHIQVHSLFEQARQNPFSE